jgi:hypothetical protein
MAQADKKLHIGIDLGTSRSSTAADNGEKRWITSYVGWPKDFVAAQVVGKEVLFGDEALENRLSKPSRPSSGTWWSWSRRTRTPGSTRW